jgi:hypothetical protein
MRPLFSDTSPDAEEVLLHCLRQMTPGERLTRALELSAEVAEIAAAGQELRLGPPKSAGERFSRLAEARLGSELFHTVYGQRREPS